MRISTVNRQTSETNISLTLNLDGAGVSAIDTGCGFFDHMLNSFATHGGFGLTVSVKGDLEVDGHHTVEDTGIVLGKAFAKALGLNKTALVVMDNDDVNVIRAAANLPKLATLPLAQLSTYEVVANNKVVMTKAAVEKFQEVNG